MGKIKFDKKELEIVRRFPNIFNMEAPGLPIYNFPVSAREGLEALYKRDALWLCSGVENGLFAPQVIPDDIARGFIIEANMMPMDQYGGKDMFGVEWEYIPVAGGSMVRPGKPLFSDANEWKETLVWPDINTWDWEGSGKANKQFLDNGAANFLWLLNGCWFERLISFMEFEDAAVALIDDEQKDAVKELFSKLTDLYCDIVDKCCETYGDGISGFTVHDDWGSQQAPFFSYDTARELIVPYMKKLTDHIKSKGMIADLHSCGHIEAQIDNIIAGGWQSWTPMIMNDTQKLYQEYGDKIIIAVADDPLPENATIEEQKLLGENFAKKFFKPGKPCLYSLYGMANLTDAYMEGLYTASRQMV